MAHYRQGDLNQAAALMDASERTQPMSAFRCWSALQMGLATGNRARIDRECRISRVTRQFADKFGRYRKLCASEAPDLP